MLSECSILIHSKVVLSGAKIFCILNALNKQTAARMVRAAVLYRILWLYAQPTVKSTLAKVLPSPVEMARRSVFSPQAS